jgi:hypothetical protein
LCAKCANSQCLNLGGQSSAVTISIRGGDLQVLNSIIAIEEDFDGANPATLSDRSII